MTTGVQIYHFPGHPAVEQGLIDFAEDLKRIWPGTTLGVMTGGWCSPKGDWEGTWICPELLEIKHYFKDRLPGGNWDVVAWFNILEPGGTIATHNHWQAEFACAYHVKGEGGLLLDFGNRSEILPATPGRLVVFPGTLMHSVPQPVPARRFSIAMNAHERRP